MPFRGHDARRRARERVKGRRALVTAMAAVGLSLVTACSDSPGTGSGSPLTEDHAPAAIPDAVRKVTVGARDQLCESAEALERQVAALTRAPTAQRLQEARAQWSRAHAHWRVWQLIQWIANGGAPLTYAARVDAHPILPGYLDRVPGYPTSGLVFSEVPLDGDALTQAHQSTDLYYGTLGFHPLEFMLWGVPDKSGAPSSRHDAFEDPPSADPDTVPAATRRRALTASIAGQLSMDLSEICPPAPTPHWLPELAQQMAGDQERQQALSRWLERLSARLAIWQQNPDGQDRNGMPLWHSAFARSDFAELKVELDWLLKHHWPASGASRSTAEPLREALGSLAKTPLHQPAEDAARFSRALEAAIALEQRLSPPAASPRQDARDEATSAAEDTKERESEEAAQ